MQRGICGSCATNEAVEGGKTCQRCRDYWKMRRDEARAKAICTKCRKAKAAPRARWCTACTQRTNQARMARPSQGLCYCGEHPKEDNGLARCNQCAVKGYTAAKEKYATAKDQGLCPRCLGPTGDQTFVRCGVCKEEDRRRNFFIGGLNG